MEVVAKPASTVVLMDNQSRVYLTKRPGTMRFMGNYYVFPGGAVDESDYDFEFPIDFQEKYPDPDYRGFYIAAARELFEEVGILMTAELLSLQEKEQLTYRQQLVKGEISLNEMIKRENLLLDFNSLTEFAHFTTPAKYPIRFCTKFFIAKLPQNQTPTPDEHEIADAIWLSPEDALEAGERGEILLSHPTTAVLERIIHIHS